MAWAAPKGENSGGGLMGYVGVALPRDRDGPIEEVALPEGWI